MFPTSTVGRKILMAATGQFMILYVIAHVSGISTIYTDGINAYAEGLRRGPFLLALWSSRVLLLAAFVLHAAFGILIKLENRRARHEDYSVTNYLKATFAGRNMIWTGAATGSFLVYHVLHFGFQITNPALSAVAHPDALGRPDVLMMVARSFQDIGISTAYIAGMAALGLHLFHGIQSSFQTWGLNNDRTLPLFVMGGTLAATFLFLGYIAIPVLIIMGMLK